MAGNTNTAGRAGQHMADKKSQASKHPLAQWFAGRGPDGRHGKIVSFCAQVSHCRTAPNRGPSATIGSVTHVSDVFST
jgi:hypothetical protein